MRVAFVFPNYWPYVRRGVERLMSEYAAILCQRGHHVTILTSKPGPGRVDRQDHPPGGCEIRYLPQFAHPVLAARWPTFRFYSFTLAAAQGLARTPVDLVHVWHYSYTLPVRVLRAIRGTPYLYHSMVDPFVAPGKIDRLAFTQTVAAADGVAALTENGAARLAAHLGRTVSVLPPCVDLAAFHPVPRLDPPRVLFTSDLLDYRKGAALLLRAWELVHQECPAAVLTIASPFGQGGVRGFDPRSLLLQLVPTPTARAQIEWIGEGNVTGLPRRYAEAAVTVLPAVEEAFGLVLIESLASGTPVVTNQLGGTGEVVTDPHVGTTFPIVDRGAMSDPQCARDLANAILRNLDRARLPDTAARCRAHAEPWGREPVGDRLLGIYTELLTGRQGQRPTNHHVNRAAVS